MSVFSKIKSLLPASSRSFHEMFANVIRIREQNERIMQLVDSAERNSQHILDFCNRFERRFDAFEAESNAILWELYRDANEELRDAKKRLFMGLPQAGGALRRHQLMLVDLLRRFDEICQQNDIEYFLAVGTLLGAIRHEGFVPWDDDIDVGVLREDIETLIGIVNATKDYEITVVYDQYSFCRQIRFKLRGSDDGKDPFIDLFIYEYSGCQTDDDLRQIKGIREELMREFASNPDRYPLDTFVYVEDAKNYKSIQDVYENYRARAIQEGLYSDKAQARSIIWSLENLSFGNPTHIIPIEDYRHMKSSSFEGAAYPVLDHSEELLTKHYDDWLKMPTDINNHKHYAALE